MKDSWVGEKFNWTKPAFVNVSEGVLELYEPHSNKFPLEENTSQHTSQYIERSDGEYPRFVALDER